MWKGQAGRGAEKNYTDTQGHFHKVGRGVSSWGGFSFDFFLKFCVDVDECVSGKHDCPAEHECVNTLGSYQCSHCRPGYIDDGETCQGKICIQWRQWRQWRQKENSGHIYIDRQRWWWQQVLHIEWEKVNKTRLAIIYILFRQTDWETDSERQTDRE